MQHKKYNLDDLLSRSGRGECTAGEQQLLQQLLFQLDLSQTKKAVTQQKLKQIKAAMFNRITTAPVVEKKVVHIGNRYKIGMRQYKPQHFLKTK